MSLLDTSNDLSSFGVPFPTANIVRTCNLIYRKRDIDIDTP